MGLREGLREREEGGMGVGKKGRKVYYGTPGECYNPFSAYQLIPNECERAENEHNRARIKAKRAGTNKRRDERERAQTKAKRA